MADEVIVKREVDGFLFPASQASEGLLSDADGGKQDYRVNKLLGKLRDFTSPF